MNELKIVVKTKNVYGKELVYPICEKAALFARLAGTKTLSDNVLGDIIALGYAITEQQRDFKCLQTM